jgi:hypothetical protein
MFRAACRSSSGAPNCITASGLYTHLVTGRCPGWVETQREQRLLMMSGMPLETC